MPKKEHGYIPRVDAVRTLLMVALILSAYRLPLPLTRYFMLLCNFAPCALFALYGYFVLKPRARLQKNILRTGRVFLLMLAVYTVLGSFYQWLYYGRPFSWISLPNFLTFLVFSRWPINLGDSIWLIQTVLYALLIFAAFRKLSGHRVLDGIVCGVLLLLGIVFGELAGNLHMPFYIERNFLTTTIPYMLLGKLLQNPPEKIKNLSSRKLLLIFAGSIVLCAAEALLFRQTGTLDYCEHLIGFIPMTSVTVLFAVRGPAKEKINEQDMRLSSIYRFMYYLYNPVAEFYFILTIFLIGFPNLFNFTAGATAVVAPVLTYLLAKVIVKRLIPNLRKSKRAKMKGDALTASLNVVHAEGAETKWSEKDPTLSAKAEEKDHRFDAENFDLDEEKVQKKDQRFAAESFDLDEEKAQKKDQRFAAESFDLDEEKAQKKDHRFDAKDFDLSPAEKKPDFVIEAPEKTDDLEFILNEFHEDTNKD